MSGGLRRVSVAVSAGEAEVARARLLELCPEGFEELVTPSSVELVAYTDDEGEARVRAAFENVHAAAVPSGWEDRWKEFHRPVRAGGIWIGPPWAEPPAGEPAVAVDPGRAFGTGAHPTTRASLELLAGLERGSLLDAGCGSGVIAVAAVLLGFAPVAAVDSDPVAVEVARETVRRNGVRVDVRWADVLRDELPDAAVVVANIELAVVERLLARIRSSVAVTSGYLEGQEPRAAGWEIVGARALEGWAANVLRASGH